MRPGCVPPPSHRVKNLLVMLNIPCLHTSFWLDVSLIFLQTLPHLHTILDIIFPSPDDGSLEPKLYSVDFLKLFFLDYLVYHFLYIVGFTHTQYIYIIHTQKSRFLQLELSVNACRCVGRTMKFFHYDLVQGR